MGVLSEDDVAIIRRFKNKRRNFSRDQKPYVYNSCYVFGWWVFKFEDRC